MPIYVFVPVAGVMAANIDFEKGSNQESIRRRAGRGSDVGARAGRKPSGNEAVRDSDLRMKRGMICCRKFVVGRATSTGEDSGGSNRATARCLNPFEYLAI